MIRRRRSSSAQPRAERAFAAAAVAGVLVGVLAGPASAAVVKYRVNAGGPALSGVPAWTEDTRSAPSPFTRVPGYDNLTFATTATIDQSDPTIPLGTPAELFTTERWDTNRPPGMAFAFPVSPGQQYLVRLFFGEAWDRAFAPGIRMFDVLIEDRLVLDDYDQFAETGPNSSTVKAFRVMAGDTSLDILFEKVVQNAAIKGIEILELAPGEDVDAPDTNIVSGIRDGKSTRSRTPKFRFEASEPGARFACRQDFQAWAACAGTARLSRLAEGVHSFRVRAIDAAGNADQSSATRTFTVDRTKPSLRRVRLRPTALTGASSGPLFTSRRKSGSAILRYRLSESALVRAKVQVAAGGSFRTLRGSGRFNGDRGSNRIRFTGRLRGRLLAPGRYRLVLAPRDAAGNRGAVKRARFQIR